MTPQNTARQKNAQPDNAQPDSSGDSGRPQERARADAKRPAKSKTPKQGAAPALSHTEIRAIVVGIMLAMFLGALDQTIVATALPTIGRAFGDVENLSWVVTAYLLTATAVTPLYGKLSDIHGRRAVLLTGITIFVAGSIACALAPSMTALVFARAVQGMGGGGLIALAQTIIADIVSPRERGRYQGYIGVVFASSSVGGPVLGGVLAQHFHWSLIFWINLPLGIAAFAMTNAALRRLPFQARKHKLDVIGAMLMMAASVALLLALSWGGTRFAWISTPIGGLVAASAILWALFALRLMRAPEPFLPLSVLANPIVRCAALAGACAMGTLVGLTIFVPLYFETVHHLSASESGLALIPLVGSVVVAATLAGRAMVHVAHYKRMPAIGLVAALLALAALAIWPSQIPMLGVAALLAGIGLGIGSLFPVSTVALQNAVARAHMGVATGALNFFRSLTSALIVAIFGAIIVGGVGGSEGVSVEMLARSAASADLASVFRFVFLAAGLALAFALAFLIAMEEKPLRATVAEQPAVGGGIEAAE
jgi:EmrB/QacA subfamily drug resistance transporter